MPSARTVSRAVVEWTVQVIQYLEQLELDVEAGISQNLNITLWVVPWLVEHAVGLVQNSSLARRDNELRALKVRAVGFFEIQR